MADVAWLILPIAGVAALYAAVGHGGASGYLAVMALAGVAPAEMRPAALALNILVAGIATYKYMRVGLFAWPVFWPVALLSVPCAFVGGYFVLPDQWLKILVGLFLLGAAYVLLRRTREDDNTPRVAPSRPLLLGLGAGLGLLSGLTGVGGGIFLSPIMVLSRWVSVRQASGVAALFILMNSLAGLAGFLMQGGQVPAAVGIWGMAAVLGGWLGAEWGSRYAAPPTIFRVLAGVLILAGLKMIWSGLAP